jgi:prolyl oligopeptidase PreP (S9A serine peptidase family)
MKSVLLFVLNLSRGFGLGQTAGEIQKGGIDKIDLVEDYQADVQIKAAIPFIKVPIAKAKIYFKQKDKFKVESKGIAILPKQGMSDLTGFLSNEKKYSAVLGEAKTINEHKTRLISILPTDENSEIILAKVYISTSEDLIYRTVLTTKSSGTVSIDYEYNLNKKYGLPNKMTFTVDIKKFKMPKSVASDIRNNEKEKKYKDNEKGTIVLTFSNYLVNKGISDDVFKKD